MLAHWQKRDASRHHPGRRVRRLPIQAPRSRVGGLVFAKTRTTTRVRLRPSCSPCPERSVCCPHLRSPPGPLPSMHSTVAPKPTTHPRLIIAHLTSYTCRGPWAERVTRAGVDGGNELAAGSMMRLSSKQGRTRRLYTSLVQVSSLCSRLVLFQVIKIQLFVPPPKSRYASGASGLNSILVLTTETTVPLRFQPPPPRHG